MRIFMSVCLVDTEYKFRLIDSLPSANNSQHLNSVSFFPLAAMGMCLHVSIGEPKKFMCFYRTRIVWPNLQLCGRKFLRTTYIVTHKSRPQKVSKNYTDLWVWPFGMHVCVFFRLLGAFYFAYYFVVCAKDVEQYVRRKNRIISTRCVYVVWGQFS